MSEQPPNPATLQARPGDRLVVRGHHLGEPDRDAEVLKVLGKDGAPPYLVRWEDGHESEVFPGSDVVIQHLGNTPGSEAHLDIGPGVAAPRLLEDNQRRGRDPQENS